MKDIWNDYKWWIVGVPGVLVLIFMTGGIYRVTTGGEFFPTESEENRQSRLIRCAEVYNTTPTYSQQLEGEDAGVCSGFTKEEIEAVK